MKRFFHPSILTVFQEGYRFSHFTKDLYAGIILGILALPMSIAFAIASGVRPEQGLYTAIIGGIVIAILGGSRYQISGPTGAFVILIYSIVQKYGYANLVLITLIAGVFLIVMGLCRFGTFIKFIPYPVTIGFTSGLATVIFIGQLKDFFGLRMEASTSEVIHTIHAYISHIHTFNFFAFFLAILSIGIVVFWPRVTTKIPGSLIAIIVTTLIAYFFHFPVDTIGKKFGVLQSSFPSFSFPSFSFPGGFLELLSCSFSIAVLAGIESLLSAVVADGMTGKKHCSDQELIALGVGNLVSVCFQGIPATGAIARTATNIKNGGQTPIAAIIHGITLIMIIVFCSTWFSYIPMASLSGILVVIAYNMSEWRHFAKIFRSPKYDIIVLLITFLLTVFVSLVVAIQAGVVLAAFLFINSMTKMTHAKYLNAEVEEDESTAALLQKIPRDIEVFEVYGPLFFAATESFKTALTRIHRVPKVLILRLRHVLIVDATGIRALEDIYEKTKREGIVLLLSGVKPTLQEILQKANFPLRKDYIFSDFDQALPYALEMVEKASTTVQPASVVLP
ncbi:MAG: STAS domain-containing protein [Parachlamydiales bacterium]|nr:STAS domain-containing protein [Parachlamydiales bacterium]